VAATMTADSDLLTYAHFPIEKFEKDADGDLLVFGRATDGTVDSDEQIVDPAWSRKALADWLETGGNVRVQHQAQRDPAGKGVGVEFTEDGHYVKALIVEPVAKRLVEKGVLRAYSVGISRPVIERDITGKARGGLIKGGVLSELSLVDRPANGNCSIQLVKSAADGTAELTGKVFGAEDFLAKAAAPDDGGITGTVTFTPADMAKLLRLRAELEKGGSSNGSNGKAGDDNDGDGNGDDGDDGDDDGDDGDGASGDDSGEQKDAEASDAEIEADDADEQVGKTGGAPSISKRKMDPDVGGGVDRDKIPAEDFAGKNRSFPIVTPGDVSDAASSIGRAGADNFSSDKLKSNIIRIAKRKGPSFVAELPQAWRDEMAGKKAAKAARKAAKGAAAVKTAGTKCKTCKGSGKILAGNRRCPDCAGDGAITPGGPGEEETTKKQVGGSLPQAAFKSGGKACHGCGKNYHSDSPARFCENCGKKLPAVEKTAKPTPGDDAMGINVDPVPEHREPDGPAIEALEHDAGLPTVPDAPLEVKAARRRAATGAHPGEAILHDLLCPAYSAKTLGDTYPWLADVRDAVDISYWRDRAVDKAAGAPIDEARHATDLWRHAETLKEASPDELARVHDELHKAFQDANPGPGSPLTPGDMQAGRYNRPLLTAGHERPSTGYTVGKPDVKVPTTRPDAGDYNRGPVTAGHERPSPSSDEGSNDKVTPPAATGRPGRTFYTNATRDSARSAMQSMHDHIAQTFPDLCPMSGKTAQPPAAQPEPDVTKTAEPEPVPPPQAGTDKTSTVNKAAVGNTITSPDLTKQIGDLHAQLEKSRRDYDELRAQVEEMARMPDPRDPPFKGLMSGYPPARAQAEPASAVQKAASTAQGTLLNDLTQTWRTDPDPATRENAYKAIQRLLGLP